MSNDKEWFDGRSLDEQLERCYWRRVGAAVFLGLVLALFVGLTQGCAPVPYCEKYQAMVGQDQDGQPVIAMTMAEVEKLANVMKGLNAGTCKLDLGGI